MTVSDLIDMLEDVRIEYGDIDVKIAMQPSWPLEARVKNVTAIEGTCYVACSEPGDYAPREAWEE